MDQRAKIGQKIITNIRRASAGRQKAKEKIYIPERSVGLGISAQHRLRVPLETSAGENEDGFALLLRRPRRWRRTEGGGEAPLEVVEMGVGNGEYKNGIWL